MAANLQIAASKIVSTNPANGEVLQEFECASNADVRAAVVRAKAAQPEWASQGMHKRMPCCENFSDYSINRNPKSLSSSPVRPASLRRSLAHGSSRRSRCSPLPDRQCVPLSAGRASLARNLAMKTKSGRLSVNPWRDRNYFSLELSLLDPGDRKHRRAWVAGTQSF